jgi:hypothetical protein
MNIIVDTTIWSKYFRRKYDEQNLNIINEMSKLIDERSEIATVLARA